ncbi:MAG: hypothetical protein IPO15_27110 [Anaerolineae bacterium]|uniref:hypothetical protein n=1 Tax=Candidatus Amarolinea dominans TaxID=3140696 RepID=UPI003136075A|nr:hypothetical protein [Anaerolineae bacterium]
MAALTLATCLAVAVLSFICTPGAPAPPRPFTTESMLMDATLFPPGWSNRPIIPTADSHGALEHPSRDMSGDGVVVHEIYRYEFVRSAQREYKRQLDVFYRHPLYRAWGKAETTLGFATRHVACASYIAPTTEGASRCGMLARYGEFVVRFSAQIAPAAPAALDEDELGELLVKLDDRWQAAMASLPTPSP